MLQIVTYKIHTVLKDTSLEGNVDEDDDEAFIRSLKIRTLCELPQGDSRRLTREPSWAAQASAVAAAATVSAAASAAVEAAGTPSRPQRSAGEAVPAADLDGLGDLQVRTCQCLL